MKKKLFIQFIVFFFAISAKAQYVQFPTVDLYDTGAMNAHLNAYREMAQRAIQISHTVQPLREQQYQYYREGKYREAVELCYDVHRQYIYYVFDNKAISDMEIIAGDCAMKLGAYESAIDWFKKAKEAGENGMDTRLNQVFNAIMIKAREDCSNGNNTALWNDVTVALKSGWESGECYYYYGICYEKSNNISEAKKMYRKAKKMNYSPAIIALKALKKRK